MTRKAIVAGVLGAVLFVLVGGTAAAEDRTQPTLDFDGDRRTDIGVARAAFDRFLWYVRSSSTGALIYEEFGDPRTDRIVPADYDGDGRTDVAVMRLGRPNVWYIHNSSGSVSEIPFGEQIGSTQSDFPCVADWDGDGRDDLCVRRRTVQGVNWFVRQSSGGFRQFLFGATSDRTLVGDFDGDGRADAGARRVEPNGNYRFFLALSTGAYPEVVFGQTDDVYVPGDFDGDGAADITVRRVLANGVHHWFIRFSSGGVAEVDWGEQADGIVAGDFTGDGRSDIAVIRDNVPPSPFTWYVRDSATGALVPPVTWGTSNDRVIPNNPVFLYNSA